jgi:hypothetical protein
MELRLAKSNVVVRGGTAEGFSKLSVRLQSINMLLQEKWTEMVQFLPVASRHWCPRWTYVLPFAHPLSPQQVNHVCYSKLTVTVYTVQWAVNENNRAYTPIQMSHSMYYPGVPLSNI